MAFTFTTTQAGASPDYMKYLEGTLTKTDRLGDAALLDFALNPWDASFVKLTRGAYITVNSSTYPNWFTGYVTNDPELTYLGTDKGTPKWGYKYQATDDSYILSLRPIGLIPAFFNQTQGQILTALANMLAPGVFDCSHIGSGLLLANYQVQPDKKFADIVKEFTDSACYVFRASNKSLYFAQQDTGSVGLTIDGNDKHFTPSRLSLKPVNTPIINDALVLGGLEPQEYVTEYYIGDGLTGQYPLAADVYGVDRNIYLDETFGGNTISYQNWVVNQGANNYLQVSNGYLNSVGGNATGVLDTYLMSQIAVPLEGNLRLTHGEWDFVPGGTTGLSGVICGLWTQAPSLTDNQTFPNCTYALRVYKQANMIPDAGLLAALGTNWTNPGGAIVTNGGAVRGNSYAITGTGAASGTIAPRSSTIAVVSGQTYTISCYIDARFCSVNAPLVGVYDTTITTAYATKTQTLGANGRVSTSFTVPGGVTQVKVILSSNNATITSGQTLVFSNPQLEVGSTATVYESTTSANTTDTNTYLSPIVNGALDRNQNFAVDTTKRYVMRTLATHSKIGRFNHKYTYATSTGAVASYGGETQTDAVSLRTYISEIDPSTGKVTRSWDWYSVIPSLSALYAQYVPMASNDLHATVTSITLSTPLQVCLVEKQKGQAFQANSPYYVNQVVRPTTANGYTYVVCAVGTSTGLSGASEPTWVVPSYANNGLTTSGDITFKAQPDGYLLKLVGPNEIDALDGLAPVATINQSNTNSVTTSSLLGTPQYNGGQPVLAFLKDTANQITNQPQEGDFFQLQYRHAGTAVGRVRSMASITSEGTAFGDNGVRSIVRSDITPRPRNSMECEAAAAAVVSDNAYQNYSGSYTHFSTYFSTEPRAGTFLAFQNLPATFPAVQAEQVTEVVTTVVNKTPELFNHALTYGEFNSLKKLVAGYNTPQGSFMPTDSGAPSITSIINLPAVGTCYAPDVVNCQLVSYDASNLNFNTNQALPNVVNLLKYTEQFDVSSTWIPQASGTGNTAPAVTANAATAPNGTTTADQVSLPNLSTVGVSRMYQVALPTTKVGTTYTFSVWIQSVSGAQNMRLQMNDAANSIVRGQNITVLPTTSWQRFSVTATIPSDSFTGLNVLIGTNSVVGTGAQVINVWGAQLEVGATPTTYFSNAGSLNTLGSFEVRYTDESWGCGAAKNLIGRYTTQTFSVPRTQRGKTVFVKQQDGRNLILDSEDMTTSNWTKTLATVSNISIANPDGNVSQVSSVAYSGVTNNSAYVLQGLPSVPVAGMSGVVSCWVKGTSGQTIQAGVTTSAGGAFVNTPVNITFSGKWQFITIPCPTVPLTTSGYTQVVFFQNGTLGAMSYLLTKVQFEVNTTTPTVYCKTGGTTPYGVMSRYASMQHVAYPLQPPAPTASFNVTDPVNPVVTVTLPAAIVDVWGVEIRASDNTTVLLKGSLVTLGYSPTVTLKNNATRSLSVYVYTYNLLGEYSNAYNLTFTIPTPTASALSVDATTRKLGWTGSASAKYYTVTSTITLAGGGTNTIHQQTTGTELALSDPQFFLNTTYVVTPSDAIGAGTSSSGLTYQYTPSALAEFNANEVAVVTAPATPTADPVLPTNVGDFAPDYIGESWALWANNRGRRS